jgi:hypothetical protein
MNRREFCQTATLFLAGSVCAGVSLHSEKRTARFRVQKIFLESWDAENVLVDSPQAASFVRQKMCAIRNNGCNGVILVPGCRIATLRIKTIVSEARSLDLKVFVPADIPRDVFVNMRSCAVLSDEAVSDEGFLLVDEGNDVQGLVLYDVSRCMFTAFALPEASFGWDSEFSVSDSRLATARWLDHAVFPTGLN